MDGYEKSLLENVGRGDLADVNEGQMEQFFSDPATVQQLLDFLKLVQGRTGDVYSRSNAWRFSLELTELYPLRYLYHEGDVVYINLGVNCLVIGKNLQDAIKLSLKNTAEVFLLKNLRINIIFRYML